jgi:hypothetical protein
MLPLSNIMSSTSNIIWYHDIIKLDEWKAELDIIKNTRYMDKNVKNKLNNKKYIISNNIKKMKCCLDNFSNIK